MERDHINMGTEEWRGISLFRLLGEDVARQLPHKSLAKRTPLRGYWIAGLLDYKGGPGNDEWGVRSSPRLRYRGGRADRA